MKLDMFKKLGRRFPILTKSVVMAAAFVFIGSYIQPLQSSGVAFAEQPGKEEAETAAGSGSENHVMPESQNKKNSAREAMSAGDEVEKSGKMDAPPKMEDHSTHGHVVSGRESKDTAKSNNVLMKKSKQEPVYTCPMHPQIRQPTEGRCPICGMELVLADSDQGNSTDDRTITLSPVARRLAGIETIMVEPKPLNKHIRAIGNITFDESRLSTIPAFIDGRIERLFADYTGVRVNKGDHLAILYSPMLYAAQVEYLQAIKSYSSISRSSLRSAVSTQKAMVSNSKSKLVELGMTPKQISVISKTGKAESRLEIYSPISGTVIAKPAAQGQYLKTGQTIFKIADLSTVWIIIDVFPEDASYIRYGQAVSATVRSIPNQIFEGRVAFISPIVNPKTRTISVRVEVKNHNGQMRPGDYAEAEISVPITTNHQRGTIFDPSLAGKHICPMHPQVIEDEPGKCRICGMTLVEASEMGFSADQSGQEELLVVPRDAVLTVGKNSVVFIEKSDGEFTIQSVVTGPSSGSEVVILDGLEEFDTIAAKGVFLLDSQMQLSGKISIIDISAQSKKQTEKK